MSARVILAGGGTAGHIEPALAVADALMKKNSGNECIFLGTESGLERLLVPKSGYRLICIPRVTLPRKFTLSIAVFPFALIASIVGAFRALSGADVLIGFGGYVSAPAYLAAKMRGVPIVIHEANAKPGWANRLGRMFARDVAVNFEELTDRWPASVLTGMPIRDSITSLSRLSEKESREFATLHRTSWNFDDGRPVIAIFGGSQGSAHINSVVAEFLKNPLSRNFQIIHALGVNNPLPQAREGYLPMAYFHDMAAIYGSSDLLITRSGAVTCSEIMTVGRYAILVPLPHGNGEQVTNAQSLVRQGRAISVANKDFTAHWLATNLEQAIRSAHSLGYSPSDMHRGAAARIADLALAEVPS